MLHASLGLGGALTYRGDWGGAFDLSRFASGLRKQVREDPVRLEVKTVQLVAGNANRIERLARALQTDHCNT